MATTETLNLDVTGADKLVKSMGEVQDKLQNMYSVADKLEKKEIQVGAEKNLKDIEKLSKATENIANQVEAVNQTKLNINTDERRMIKGVQDFYKEVAGMQEEIELIDPRFGKMAQKHLEAVEKEAAIREQIAQLEQKIEQEGAKDTKKKEALVKKTAQLQDERQKIVKEEFKAAKEFAETNKDTIEGFEEAAKMLDMTKGEVAKGFTEGFSDFTQKIGSADLSGLFSGGVTALEAAGKKGAALQVAGAGKEGAGGAAQQALGKISSMLGKLAVPLAAIAGLGGFVALLVDADARAKELNSTISEGMGAAGEDFENASRKLKLIRDEFTENFQANMKFRTTARESLEMIKALQEEGVRFREFGVQNIAVAARKITETIVVQAKMTGKSFAEMAKLQGEWAADLNMSLQTIQGSFTDLITESRSAGISTNRFFAAVQNTTSEMSLFNPSLQASAKLLKQFSTNAMLGAKDAEEALKTFGTYFQGKSVEDLLTTTVSLSTSDLKGILKNQLNVVEKQVAELESQGNLTEAQQKELSALKMTMKDLKRDANSSNRLQLAAGLKNLDAQGSAQALLKIMARDLGTGNDLQALRNQLATGQGQLMLEKLGRLDANGIKMARNIIESASKEGEKNIDALFTREARGKRDREKEAEKQRREAEQLAKETAPITKAIEMGMDYFMNKLYGILDTMNSYILDLVDTFKASRLFGGSPQERQAAEQRIKERKTQRDLAEAQQEEADLLRDLRGAKSPAEARKIKDEIVKALEKQEGVIEGKDEKIQARINKMKKLTPEEKVYQQKANKVFQQQTSGMPAFAQPVEALTTPMAASSSVYNDNRTVYVTARSQKDIEQAIRKEKIMSDRKG